VDKALLASAKGRPSGNVPQPASTAASASAARLLGILFMGCFLSVVMGKNFAG
jgi:hypothetical protein